MRDDERTGDTQTGSHRYHPKSAAQDHLKDIASLSS